MAYHPDVTIPPKGTPERAWMELLVTVIRAWRLRVIVRWMARQRWVIAYADWDEKHVPRWFTPWNVVYLGAGLYTVFVVVRLLA